MDIHSKDFTIDSIPDGLSRAKIVGVILAKNDDHLVIGDHTGELVVYNSSKLEVMDVSQKGRFMVNVSKMEKKIRADLISFLPMNKKQIQQYSRLLQLEKRIPK